MWMDGHIKPKNRHALWVDAQFFSHTHARSESLKTDEFVSAIVICIARGRRGRIVFSSYQIRIRQWHGAACGTGAALLTASTTSNRLLYQDLKYYCDKLIGNQLVTYLCSSPTQSVLWPQGKQSQLTVCKVAVDLGHLLQHAALACPTF